MNNTHITKDLANNSITIERIFTTPKEKVWEAFTDDAILTTWWGPKEWPASSMSFDFSVGGHWHYYMTGPDGTKVYGWIDYTAIDAPHSYTAQDAFCDEHGVKNTELPSTQWAVTITKDGESTKVTTTLHFANQDDLETITAMGFEEGYSSALNNLEEYLTR